MTRSSNNPWLARFALLLAATTLALLGVGGLVTSHGAGMAVPDWPTTYGYNMFLFPISQWVGGIFYEHSHRLLASTVGLLTVVLALWLWFVESRAWLRGLGWIALVAVVLQGVLGGLRVTLFKDEIGIFHATLAQLFFVLVCAIALFTSRWWREVPTSGQQLPSGSPRIYAAVTLLILGQLILGATMRHQHAGLAVPDFPLAYGKIWPPMDAASIENFNQRRVDARDFRPITAFQIGLHMMHRLVAVLILLALAFVAWTARRRAGGSSLQFKLAAGWLGLILVQLTLGIVTVLGNKPADIATLHVVTGALSLALGSLLVLVAARQAQAMTGVAGRQPAGKVVGAYPSGAAVSARSLS